MKAIVYHSYGPPDVLKCEKIEKPTAGDNEVLIKVRAAAVNPLDLLFRGTSYMVRIMTGLRKPKETRIGHDVAGQVEAVGRNVTQFKPGDAVFGTCKGAFAEYACAPESALVVKPDNVTFEQVASVPIAALTALQGLRLGGLGLGGLGDKGHIQPRQRVLINGASGGVGTFAVQIAKSFGADVTGVCSTKNVDMIRSIGAKQVFDYTREDFTKSGQSYDQRYDLILDCVGNHSLLAHRRALNPNGVCVVAGAKGLWDFLTHALAAPVLSRLVSQKFVTFIAKLNKEDLTMMRELMATGKVTPVIDRRYSLSEVPEAIRYLQKKTRSRKSSNNLGIEQQNLIFPQKLLRSNGPVAHLSFFERWDSTCLSRLGSMDSEDATLVLYFSGSSPDEKEARRCMSPRLPTFARNRGAKVPPPATGCMSKADTQSGDNGKPRGAQKHDAAYNARMAALYREVVLKEKPAQSENGFIPLGALAKPNGNGHSAAEAKPQVAEPVAGD